MSLHPGSLMCCCRCGQGSQQSTGLQTPPNRYKDIVIQDESYASKYVPIELLQQPIDFPVATNLRAINKIMKAPMSEMVGDFFILLLSS
ncbi:unnamed protein product [Toxocara canis]|uniref:Protein SRG1 n=1 Tax=Toxocara canis TaxID=6265 RepID=A0A183U2N6_TOXCA|nr:unnamed protein product [Toxocara canis]